MKRLALSLMVAALLLSGVGRARADLVPGVFNTGVTVDNNTLQTPGLGDLHYTIISGPLLTGPFVSNPPNVMWAANTAHSQWISAPGQPRSWRSGVP